jgi:molybdopterin-binding protein
VDTGPLCCRSRPKLSIEPPEQLQRKLHLPRRRACAGDRTRCARQSGRVGRGRWRKHNEIRRIEIRAVQQVENLRAKLHVQALAKSRVIQHRKIPGREARPEYLCPRCRKPDGLPAQVIVSIGEQHITSIINADAIREMQLKSGQTVTALIKSTEVMMMLQ